MNGYRIRQKPFQDEIWNGQVLPGPMQWADNLETHPNQFCQIESVWLMSDDQGKKVGRAFAGSNLHKGQNEGIKESV